MWLDRVEGQYEFNRMTFIGKLNPMQHAKLNPMQHAKLRLGSEREWRSGIISSLGEECQQGSMSAPLAPTPSMWRVPGAQRKDYNGDPPKD